MFVAVALCNVEEEPEIESYKCLESYLHSNKMMERGVRRKFKAVNATDPGCDVHLENFRDKYYEEVARAMKEDEDLSENVDCLIEQMRKFHVAEVSMKKLVYENSKKLSKRKRKKAMRAIDSAIEKVGTVGLLENLKIWRILELFKSAQRERPHNYERKRGY